LGILEGDNHLKIQKISIKRSIGAFIENIFNAEMFKGVALMTVKEIKRLEKHTNDSHVLGRITS